MSGAKWATVSALDRVMTCAASAALPQTRDVSKAAAAGTAVHSALEAACTPGAVSVAMPDGQVVNVADLLYPVGAEAEVAFSHDVISGETRRLGKLSGARAYPELPYSTICGTADVVGEMEVTIGEERVRAAFVCDLKNGHRNFLPESDSWQMRALGFMAAKSMGLSYAITRITGTRDGFINHRPQRLWMPEEMDETELLLRKVYDRINHVARKGVTVADVVHGSHCTFCPAFASCPYMASILSGGRLAQLDTRDMTQAYNNLQALKTATKRLEDAVKYAAEASPIPLGGGNFYGKTGNGMRKYRFREEGE